MKKSIFSLAALVLMTAACKKAEDKATDENVVVTDTVAVKEGAPVAMDSAAMMKAWIAYATPGEPHKMFAMDNGTWDEELTMWMMADDPKPTKTKMTAVNKMILGGRYQESRHSGMMMGEAFEGIGTMGYNNASKKMESTWVDNMGTGLMCLTGDYDAASKTTELKGECVDPMTGKNKTVRETFTIVDDNTRKMEMFDTGADGKEYKSMEIVMKRRK